MYLSNNIVNFSDQTVKNAFFNESSARYNTDTKKWERCIYPYPDTPYQRTLGKDASMAFTNRNNMKPIKWVNVEKSDVYLIDKDQALKMINDTAFFGLDQSGEKYSYTPTSGSFHKIAKHLFNSAGYTLNKENQLVKTAIYFVTKLK